MPANKYLFTTYTSTYDALTKIDTWLVSTMGYTQNCAPVADSITYTGYKAHYQYTFVSGETIYLNFHTDTTGTALYLTSSTAYSSSLNWNAQTGMPTVLSGAIIYSKIVIPTASSNNALYLFGDALGNCQVFVQRGSTISVSDFMQWGVLNKKGFGSWVGGQFFVCDSLMATTLSLDEVGPGLWAGTYSSDSPRGAIYTTVDSVSSWAGIKSFSLSAQASSNAEPSNTIGTTSNKWSSIIVGDNFTSHYEPYQIPCYENSYSDINNTAPSYNSVVVEDLPGGYVNGISGNIHLRSPFTIYARHEATQRISPIGRLPFGYHCPIAGYFQFVAPGTQLVRDGRTFILIGNIAAEMVSV